MSDATSRLFTAIERAIEGRQLPVRLGLSELATRWGGPASGSAGGIVRRWPAAGLLVAGGLRLRFEKNTPKLHGSRASVVVVEYREAPTCSR